MKHFREFHEWKILQMKHVNRKKCLKLNFKKCFGKHLTKWTLEYYIYDSEVKYCFSFVSIMTASAPFKN